MNAQEMWEAYSKSEGIHAGYDAWAFGDAPDELAELVRCGEKTATASAFPLYALEGEELPQAGQFSVILNSNDEAVCIIKTTRVYVTPFEMVDEQQAFREGEGDKSLAYWRTVHERFFLNCMAMAGLAFEWQMPVVCEEFIKVYP